MLFVEIDEASIVFGDGIRELLLLSNFVVSDVGFIFGIVAYDFLDRR